MRNSHSVCSYCVAVNTEWPLTGGQLDTWRQDGEIVISIVKSIVSSAGVEANFSVRLFAVFFAILCVHDWIPKNHTQNR